MKPESKLWQQLKRANRSVYLERVENLLGAGMPDVLYQVHKTFGGMAELKISRGKGERVIVPHFTVQQRRWLRTFIKHGGHGLLIIKHCDEVKWFANRAAWEPENYLPFHTGLKFPEHYPAWYPK